MALIAAAALLCACSGSGGTPPFGAPPSSPVGGLPSQIPFSALGQGGTVNLPAALSAPPGDSGYAIASTSPPTGVPALPTTGGATVLFYLAVGFSAPTTFSGQPGISYNVGGTSIDVTKGPIYLAELAANSTVWQQPFAGPAETFSSNAQVLISTGTAQYPGGIPVVFALYQTINPAFPILITPTSAALTTRGQTATFTAVAQNYTGTFSATSQNTNVATVTPASGTTFTVTAIGAGSTTIAVTDSKGATTAFPVTVTFAPILLSTTTQAFTSIGQTQAVTATVAGYSGVISAVSSNPSVATVSTSGGGNFTLSAAGAGSTTITFSDTDGTTATLTVTVTFAPIILSSANQSFTAVGQTKTVTATVAGYSGAISATSANSGVTTVTANGGGQFTLTAIAAGSTTVTFSDTNGTTTTLPVTVTLTGGNLTIQPPGTVTTFGIPGGTAPSGIVTGSDHNLWFTEPASSVLAQITTAGAITQFPFVLPAASGPLQIASGSDGYLYVSEPTAASIGIINIVPAPNQLSQPTATVGGLSVGPNGKMWATVLPNMLCSVSSSGVFPCDATPSATPGLGGLTTGSDGRLWFTESTSNNIAALTLTSAAIAEYPIPTAGANVTSVAAGTDGNLWITETAANKIARVSPSGTVTEFTSPFSGGQPTAIISGPDGNLWYIDAPHNAIVRVTTQGIMTSISVGIGSSPVNVAAGPDGNLYVTLAGTTSIAQVVP